MANAWLLKPLPFAAVTADATSAGYAPTNVGLDYMGVVWEHPSGAGSRVLTVDLGADTVVDTAMLFGVTPTNANLALQVEASTAALGSTFPAGAWVGQSLPMAAGTDPLPASGRRSGIWIAPTTGAPPASRYWRFTITGTSQATQVARLVIGKRIVLARNFGFGGAFGVRDFGTFDFSNRGVLLRRRSKKLRTVGLTFSNAYKDEVEAAIAPLLEEIGNTDCVALVTDPASDPQRQRRSYYGPLVGDLGTVQRNGIAFEWRANLVSLA